MFNHHRHGNFRIVIGGKADKNAVIGDVFAQLGRAGFGAGVHHAVFEVSGETAGGEALHAGFHRVEGRGADFHHVFRLRAAHSQYAAAVVGFHSLQEVSLTVLAAGDQRGDIIGQLQRRVELVGLTEGRPGSLILSGGVFRKGAGPVADLNAGGLAQTKGGKIFPQGVHLHAVAHLREKVVTGVGDGLCNILKTMTGVIPASGVAAGGVAGIVPDSGVPDFFGQDCGSGLQSGYGSQGLEGGAGGIGAHGGPVQLGAAGVLIQGVDILRIGFQLKGGVGGQGQYLAGTHLHHRGGRAAGLVVVLGIHFGDGGGQGVLRGCLKAEIQRQLHGAAGLRLRFIVFSGDFPLAVGGQHPGSVLSVEVFLEGPFRAAVAHNGVPGIILIGGILLILGVHGAHDAQHMSGIGRQILPGRGGDHLGAQIISVV